MLLDILPLNRCHLPDIAGIGVENYRQAARAETKRLAIEAGAQVLLRVQGTPSFRMKPIRKEFKGTPGTRE